MLSFTRRKLHFEGRVAWIFERETFGMLGNNYRIQLIKERIRILIF